MSYKYFGFIIIIILLLAPTIASAAQTKPIFDIQNMNSTAYILRDGSGVKITTSDYSTLVSHEGFKPSHVRGGRIYDDFTIELGTTPAAPNELLLAAIPTNPAMSPPSITEGWRCSNCHGYDYEGGVYTFNNGATNNLLELRDVRGLNEEAVIKLLTFGFSIFNGTTSTVVHKYDDLLPMQSIVDVADFVVNDIYDTKKYLRATNHAAIDHMPYRYIIRGVLEPRANPIPASIRIDGSAFTCNACHGLKGRDLPGFDLYFMGWANPLKWLHRVNFGSPRSLQTYPDITKEDTTIHPGLFEVVLTDGLHFAGPEEASGILEFIQTHFAP